MTPALPITLEQYLGKYADHPDITPEIRGNAVALLELVNAGLLLMQGDGVLLRVNPITGSLIGGSGNGGVRPQNAVDRNGRPVGAGHSKHKDGRAIDLFDPARELVAWSLANRDRLIAIGILAIERPQWTPSWAHWQDVAVASGHFAFVPSNDPPLIEAIAGELAA